MAPGGEVSYETWGRGHLCEGTCDFVGRGFEALTITDYPPHTHTHSPILKRPRERSDIASGDSRLGGRDISGDPFSQTVTLFFAP